MPSADKAFVWFQALSAITGFISWAGIGAVHIRFRRAYLRQGRSIEELPYKSAAYPFSGLFACILSILIILGQGYGSFTPQFNANKFCTSYIGVVPFILCYAGHKLITRKKVVQLEEVDFETGRVTRFDIEKDEEMDGRRTFWKRVLNIIA
jgi:lysine-specific permease